METSQKITHVLDRLGFGPRPGDRQRVESAGVEAYIEQQLNPPGTVEPAALASRLSNFSMLELSPTAIFERHATPRQPTDEQRRKANERQDQIARETQEARLLRSLESAYQLQEVMVDFWFNHFNVFAGKALTRLWFGSYEQAAIRPHVLGKFRDLLGATAKHPAMLSYLDNWLNTDPGSEAAKGRFKGLNENYARELMELHTLGVNGGYSQADVESLARIFTGWSLVHHQQAAIDESGFVFVENRHDASDKVLLDTTIASGGVAEGEAALDLLSQHPATARHISYKLAQYFVADTPPPSLVDRLASRFTQTDGDIREVLSTLFSEGEFWDTAHYQRKFKTPYQYVLSMSRAIGLTDPKEDQLNPLSGAMKQLNMPLYNCRMPDGYAQVESAWLSPDSMLRRVSLAISYVNQRKDLIPAPDVLLETLGNPFSASSLATIRQSPEPTQAALILGSPEMMYR
ncbi:MAG: DUF1800 domain-containing protein [Cyanobacteria bacterium J06626_6]